MDLSDSGTQRSRTILTYRLPNPVRMDCAVNLNELLPIESERKSFDRKWRDFIASDDANKSIYQRK
ncbi:MAG: hypothetical protein J7L66_03595, partial [Anaerolineaceae bacterium]|nr:hypothetical protein [Anaerolineaceae bacterium]